MPTCIGYATSSSPVGPYTYGGTIINNDHCNPGNWNNHGSIVEFNGNWYVFYQRSTHSCNTMRKACVEPIHFNADGFIPKIEMTSQGGGDWYNDPPAIPNLLNFLRQETALQTADDEKKVEIMD